jgi:hypothetical protein
VAIEPAEVVEARDEGRPADLELLGQSLDRLGGVERLRKTGDRLRHQRRRHQEGGRERPSSLLDLERCPRPAGDGHLDGPIAIEQQVAQLVGER